MVENEQRGHGPHAVMLGESFIILHVHSGIFDAESLVLRDGFKNRRHGLARARPPRPKLDEHRLHGVKHFSVEVRFVQFNDVVVHNLFLIWMYTEASNLGQRGLRADPVAPQHRID